MNNTIKKLIEKMMENTDMMSIEYCFCELDYEDGRPWFNVDCSADRVYWDNKRNCEWYPRGHNEKSSLFLRVEESFFGDGETLFVDMENGNAYHVVCADVTDLGVMDKEDFKALLPAYKKLYLEENDGYFGDNFWLNEVKNEVPNKDIEFLGIRDNFSVMANEKGVLPWACGGILREYK